MNIKIEKRPMNNEENYFVFRNGEKSFEMSVASVKAILLLWVFFGVTFFAFYIGSLVQAQNTMMTAYLMQGNLTDGNNVSITCNPLLTKKNTVEWNCINSTERTELVTRP